MPSIPEEPEKKVLPSARLEQAGEEIAGEAERQASEAQITEAIKKESIKTYKEETKWREQHGPRPSWLAVLCCMSHPKGR